MKAMSIFLLMIGVILIMNTSFAQDNISSKLTPSAIDARIAKIRMGDITVKTKAGADVKVQQVRHEFLFGTAITNQLAEKTGDAMSPEDRKMFLKILSENFTPYTKTP